MDSVAENMKHHKSMGEPWLALSDSPFVPSPVTLSFRPQVSMIASVSRFSPIRHSLGLACAALGFAAFVAAPRAQPVDTLEVFVLYIEFQDEGPNTNEPGTTGRGIFGSDPDLDYDLDPNGTVRRSAAYITKRFELAQDYFDRVSNGRVHIVPRLFPPPGTGGLVVPPRLDDRMKAYNPAIEDKSAKQKTSDFSRQRAIQLMRFVSETARRHDVVDSATNPFRVAQAIRTPTRHPAFLIFHAGHSRLIDGGTLGYLGANTPNDFTDFFVTRPDFRFLGDSLAPAALRGDSLGVPTRGDTITQFMMLSESATQEGVNWGINGILINQLARQMGMPDLFDVVKGISQVGTFDVMDFAGYNTMMGFLPVFPSAWSRSFMGWDEPVTASPADAGPEGWSEYRIHAADQPGPGRIRTLKVPINEREYLLVENRQRAAGADSVTVWFSAQSDRATDFAFSVDTSVTVPYAFIDTLFLDSLCVPSGTNRCASKVKNMKRPRGVITRASHYDMGLPGNGLLTWHVNEWFMELLLPSGAVNAWLGDTLRNQYKGLELVEADGVPSIGKEFFDPLGQPAFDYGTARDMLPHVYRKRRNPPRDTTWGPRDTLRFIGPWGLANTNAWNDGRTHVSIEAVLPATPVLSPGTSSFSGDSVLTVRDSAITVRVHWPSNNSVRRPAGSRWPVRTAEASAPRAVSVLRDGAGPARHRARPRPLRQRDRPALQRQRAPGRSRAGELAGGSRRPRAGQRGGARLPAGRAHAARPSAGGGPRRFAGRRVGHHGDAAPARRTRHLAGLRGQNRAHGLRRPRVRARQRAPAALVDSRLRCGAARLRRRQRAAAGDGRRGLARARRHRLRQWPRLAAGGGRRSRERGRNGRRAAREPCHRGGDGPAGAMARELDARSCRALHCDRLRLRPRRT